MTNTLTKAVTAVSIAVLTSTAAMALDLNNNNSPKFKVVKAQLAIASPNGNTCPAPAKMSGWIFTNKPGKFQYMIARKGGSVSGPYTATSKTGSNGLHMASFSNNFPVHASINAHYRILIGNKYGKTLSNWAPLKVTCS